MTVNQIVELVGGANGWGDIYAEFGNMSRSEVLTELNSMYPHDDNEGLAEKIADGIRYYGEEGPHPRAEW